MPDNENTIKAGHIHGNPLNGLCERMVIEVPRVFDGCISRYPSLSFQLVLTDITPGMLFPYTFINVISQGDVVFANQVITLLEGRRARITGDIIIPVVVTFSDSTGRIGTGRSSISLHRDIILNVPVRSLIPYTVSVTASVAGEIGTFINETTVNVLCCVVAITKIIVMSDIVVPCYGFSVYPDCTEGSADLCSALLNLPLFPPLE